MKRTINRIRDTVAVIALPLGTIRLRSLIQQPTVEIITVVTYSVCIGIVLYTLLKSIKEHIREE